MTMQWVLNSNGLSFLTADEQTRFYRELAAKNPLRFRAEHGMVTDDGENHLWCGDRIIGTWQEPPPPPPPTEAPAPGSGYPGTVRPDTSDRFAQELALIRAELVHLRTLVVTQHGDGIAMLSGISEALANLHNALNPSAPTTEH